MTNRAIRLHARNDLRLETAPDPAPGPGEVRVAVRAGGICGSDLHYWADGGIGTIRVREPIILGHEFAGHVESLGPGVTGLAAGDVVAVNPSQPCGACRFCDEGQPHHCLHMRFTGSAMFLPHEQGGFRDRITVAAGRCARLSPGTDP
ncbi:alcohol dehydrogenase catalytic domain-containing protein, partial [Limimaricola sp. ASW11-118]